MDRKRGKRIIFLFCGRFPSERAAAIFLELEAAAYAAAGSEVVILAPRRFGRKESAEQQSYRTIYLPTIDLFGIGFLGNIPTYVNLLVFSKLSLLWLWLRGEKTDIVISNEPIPLLFASVVSKNLLYEMHDFPNPSFLIKLALRRMRWVLTVTAGKAKKISNVFGVPSEQIIIERNAADLAMFAGTDKRAARQRLAVDATSFAAVYTGHLYEWKGVDTLAQAAALRPDALFYFVGGTEADVRVFTERWGNIQNIRIVGHVPHETVPLWQSAADLLVLPNSGKEDISLYYTSPMKLFEYMASERPIVASDIPSIREVLSPDIAYLCKADDPRELARVIGEVMMDADTASRKAAAARDRVAEYTWEKRADRLLSRLTI